MNNGAFGENFPYTNFHDLNTDWIIKIAKDFLDQYTHIQEVIANGETSLQNLTTSGLEQLQNKADALEALLQQWYDTHSADIANQLANAIADLNNWYSDNIQSFEDFSDSEIARITASIPSDYSSLANSALCYKPLADSASAFHNKLAEVNVLSICQIMASQGWTDMPAGTTAGTFFNYKYSPDYFIQVFIDYPSLTRYTRVTNGTNGTVAVNWIEDISRNDVESMIESDCLHLQYPLSVSDYSNTVANIHSPIMSPIVASHGWVDLPTDFTAGTIIVYKYSQTNFVQTLIEYPSIKTYMRVTTFNGTTGTANTNWIEMALNSSVVDISNRAMQYKFSIGNPADYDNLLAKLNMPVITAVLRTQGWTDLPENENAGILITYQYSTNYSVQEFISLTLNSYRRIVDTSSGTLVIDWKPFATDSTIWCAIGDSTTAGSYSTPEGESVVYSNAPWSYPNRIRDMVKGTVYNLGVPGAKISQFTTQIDSIPNNTTLITIMGGINDYMQNSTIGTISDTGTSTVMGALKTCIENAYAKAPNARIVLISPLNAKFGTLATKYAINHRQNNFTLAELITAMEEVADYYKIEFINATENVVNMLNISDVLKDNVHPTQKYYQTVAEFIKSKLY